jgi:hypothetical protein
VKTKDKEMEAAEGDAADTAAEAAAVQQVLTTCGATAAQRTAITEEGFTSLEDFLILTIKDVAEMAMNVTHLAVNRGGVHIGAVLTKKLQGLVWWCLDRHRRGQALVADEFTQATLLEALE